MRKLIVWAIALLLCVVFTASAQATTLTGNLTADDYFEAYISTNDSIQGTLIGQGFPDLGTDNFGWKFMFSIDPTTITNPPSTWFLHVKAWDGFGVIAGFRGDLKLSDTGFKFNNGTQSLLTNTTDWKVSAIGFDGVYAATPTVVVPHPSWPAPIADQSWIWTNGGASTDTPRYFSTKITAVPEASTLIGFGSALIMAGPGMIGWLKRRRPQ
jgi:MSHA biogenesis protein MshQ